MPQSHSYILVHVIFSTRYRRSLLNKNIREQLFPYIAETTKNIKCSPVIVGGIEDHIHILLFLGREAPLAATVGKIKSNSSRWLKTQSKELYDFQWQRGYSAFSVSKSRLGQLKKYIAGQEEHHKKMSFKDELRKILDKHEIDYDEKYLWD
jgi:putative transposase